MKQQTEFEKTVILSQVAKETGLGRAALVGLIRRGELRGAKIGKCWHIPRSDVQRFYQERFGQGQDEKQAA